MIVESFAVAVEALGVFYDMIRYAQRILKGHKDAELSKEMLDQQVKSLNDALNRLRAQILQQFMKDEAAMQQDMISRGLGNSTILQSQRMALSRDAYAEIRDAELELNRVVEEIALRRKSL